MKKYFFTLFVIALCASNIHAQQCISIGSEDDMISNSILQYGIDKNEYRRPFLPNPALWNFTEQNVGDTLLLAFFTDRQYRAVVQHVTKFGKETVAVTAKIIDFSTAYCYIAISEKNIYISAEIPAADALFTTAQKDGHTNIVLQKLSYKQRENTMSSSIIPAIQRNSIKKNNRIVPKDAPDSNTPVTVDLLIVYTPAAKAFAESNGSGGIDMMIANAMQRANTTLSNSETYVTLNLAHSQEINYTEQANPEVDLRSITNTDDGIIDEVHLLRGQYNADLVTLLVANTGSGISGAGWTYTTKDFGYSEHGFSVVRINNIADDYTMIHEIGHNFGCGHHIEIDNIGMFAYSHGRRATSNQGTKYSTVMTYATGRSYSTDPYIPYPRIPYFSNPNIIIEGSAIGTAGGENNAKTIRQTKSFIERYDQEFLYYDTFLKELTVSEGTLSPAFNPVIKEYQVFVPTGTTKIDVSATKIYDDGLIEGTGTDIPIDADEKTITIKVLSNWGEYEKIYTIKILRGVAPQPIVFPTAEAVTYHPQQTLGSINLVGGTGNGAFAWANPDVVPVCNNTGYEVVFTPITGTPSRQKITLTVHKAVPEAVVFPATAAINCTDQLQLSDIELRNGSGDGVFSWTDPTIIPVPNNQGYMVVFTPNDAVNYNYTGISVQQKVALAVHKVPQQITFEPIDDHAVTDAPFNLNASASSSLPIVYESSDKTVATVDNEGVVTLKSTGTTKISACQAGDNCYMSLCSYQLLTVTEQVTATEDPAAAHKYHLYPNPVMRNGTIYLTTGTPLHYAEIEIFDHAGRLVQRVKMYDVSNDTISLRAPAYAGIYLFVVKNGKQIHTTVKVVVN